MIRIHDYVLIESEGEGQAYLEGMRHSARMGAAYIHAARVRVEQAVAGEAQALESYQKALDIEERTAVVADAALNQRDEALNSLEGAEREYEALQAECEKLADQRESALYDRDCLEEKLQEEESCHEATQARLDEAIQIGLDCVTDYQALENEHERLEKENTLLQAENSKLTEQSEDQAQALGFFKRAYNRDTTTMVALNTKLNRVQTENHELTQRNHELSTRNVVLGCQLADIRAQLKKAESALAAAGVVITILEATGDNIKKLPG